MCSQLLIHQLFENFLIWQEGGQVMFQMLKTGNLSAFEQNSKTNFNKKRHHHGP